jgi:hypothetical protein
MRFVAQWCPDLAKFPNVGSEIMTRLFVTLTEREMEYFIKHIKNSWRSCNIPFDSRTLTFECCANMRDMPIPEQLNLTYFKLYRPTSTEETIMENFLQNKNNHTNDEYVLKKTILFSSEFPPPIGIYKENEFCNLPKIYQIFRIRLTGV